MKNYRIFLLLVCIPSLSLEGMHQQHQEQYPQIFYKSRYERGTTTTMLVGEYRASSDPNDIYAFNVTCNAQTNKYSGRIFNKPDKQHEWFFKNIDPLVAQSYYLILIGQQR